MICLQIVRLAITDSRCHTGPYTSATGLCGALGHRVPCPVLILLWVTGTVSEFLNSFAGLAFSWSLFKTLLLVS